MKNMLKANTICIFPKRLEKIACRTCTEKSQRKLARRYGEASHPQRNDCEKQQRFYQRLHAKAMDIIRAEMRDGDKGGWRSFFVEPFCDSVERYNSINKGMLPHIAKFIKKPQPAEILGMYPKLREIARELAGGDLERMGGIFKEMMGFSLRVKRWLAEGKIKLYHKEVCGKMILGFDFVNYDGSKGGFVNAKCHFHRTGKIFISEKSLVLGEAVFVGNVNLRCCTVGSGRFENVNAFASVLSKTQARFCNFDHAKCEEASLAHCRLHYSTVKRSGLSHSIASSSIILDTFGDQLDFDNATEVGPP